MFPARRTLVWIAVMLLAADAHRRDPALPARAGAGTRKGDRARSPDGPELSVLQVRDLAVEVGGRLTLTGAFVLAARRRQGRTRRPQRRGQDVAAARCSAGATPAGARRRAAPGARRLPPAGPARARRRSRRHRALARAVGARPRRRRAPARGAARQGRRRPVGAQREGVRQRRGRVHRVGRLRGRVGGPAHRRRPRPSARPARPADQRAVGRRAPAGRARAHPVRGRRPHAARRADEPPRRRRQGSG